MAPTTTNIAILFADISGSTTLYEVLGDSTAQSLITTTLDTIAGVTRRFNGTVIKTIGDEIMCTFDSAADAATAACEMHEILEDETDANSDPITIRIGMHFGPALSESGDIFGDAVNTAARMTALAKARQIMTTKSTIDLLPSVMQAGTRFVDHASLKGKQGGVDIYEIIWQQDDVTRMAAGMLPDDKKPSQVKLHLNYNGQVIVLDHDRSSIVIGRSQGCDLSINEKLASRQHVRIELRREKFIIIDQSTNGTHVRINDNGDAFLRREEMPLSGTGCISLGRAFNDKPTEVVHFSHEYS
ncbi:class 3 adenylate cyclase [Methylohalomonas lacus]|uniref:Class 3 adenylate cyclase n=1 Tax=Methylohalomonas lacus TaxID=398773 RepID=A0AAE3HHM2_9GAMM|nr:adenylate/guanylate cyclase domain-containing protein [Methylohalomonas lacus]MCS3902434.1 class 3 adenylate cyclase [Methylohalomonas lacus]